MNCFSISSSAGTCSGCTALQKYFIVHTSPRKRRSTSGYCTFTTTCRPPSRSVARCTCPMLAAPIGASSKSSKTSPSGFPYSSSTIALTVSKPFAGTLSWSTSMVCTHVSGKALPMLEAAIWPVLV